MKNKIMIFIAAILWLPTQLAAEASAENQTNIQITLGWLDGCPSEYDVTKENIMDAMGVDWNKNLAINELVLGLFENNAEADKAREYLDNPLKVNQICGFYLKGILRGLITANSLKEMTEN